MGKGRAGTRSNGGGRNAKRSAQRAVIYCRVSSQEQLKGLSLETQSQACVEYCRAHGMEVAEIFVERGESASTADRTQLQKMLSYCRQHRGRVHFLVVYMLDRFARNQYDHHALKALLQKLGITLRAVAQPIDDSATGKLMDGILAAFSEFDNNLRRDRCVTGMQAAASRGRWVFPPPLGYQAALKPDGTKTIEPDPETAPLLRHAFEMAASGVCEVVDILREMRIRGLKGSRGGKISSSALHKILRKPLYYGRLQVDKWGIDVDGDFDGIVDEETWVKAQAAISGKRELAPRYRIKHPDFPLRRFVRCGLCEGTISGAWSKGKRPATPTTTAAAAGRSTSARRSWKPGSWSCSIGSGPGPRSCGCSRPRCSTAGTRSKRTSSSAGGRSSAGWRSSPAQGAARRGLPVRGGHRQGHLPGARGQGRGRADAGQAGPLRRRGGRIRH